MKPDPHSNETWNGKERRVATHDRRRSPDRRCRVERRQDNRTEAVLPRRSLRCIMRMLLNTRMGVDRRKGDRRQLQDRRSRELRSILTPEELAALLGPLEETSTNPNQDQDGR